MAKPLTALERISILEKANSELVSQLETHLTQINQRQANMANQLEKMTEVVSAVVELVGRDQVGQTRQRLVKEHEEEVLKQKLESVEKQVAEGVLIASPVVTDASIVVFDEVTPSGNQRTTCTAFFTLVPEFQALLLGKSVGEETVTPNGVVVKVTNVYCVTESK
jgi:hypothetical protein